MSQTVEVFKPTQLSHISASSYAIYTGDENPFVKYFDYLKLETEHQKALATVLDRESASTARYDAKIDGLEADNLSLRQLLKEYRNDTRAHDCCYIFESEDFRCSICRKYDALEGK